MMLHEFVEWFHDDLANAPVDVENWADKLTEFCTTLTSRYPNVDQREAPVSYLLAEEGPDHEHDVVTELRSRPGVWFVVQWLPSRGPNQAAFACDSHDRVQLVRTYRAYYARYVPDDEIDAQLIRLLDDEGGRNAA